MNGGSARRARRRVRGVTALLLGSAASGAWAQVQPEPLPPEPATTTIVEQPAPPPEAEPPVVAEPDKPKVEEPKHAPPNAGGIPLSTLETDNQSLLYFDPIQTYLTPYIGAGVRKCARVAQEDASTGSRGTGRRSCSRTSATIGNAAARSSPNNAVLLDVAPLSQRMETFTPGERFFTLINHELAHVATMDVWNKQGRLLAAVLRAASRCRSRSIRNRSSTTT